ncbi:MAG: SMC-Scp complex subunit ScpB [Deltaproteobacteria bacterium]|nr:SMC-Scp complex subunit ScpB [Deltaproteobacteria bacterium]
MAAGEPGAGNCERSEHGPKIGERPVSEGAGSFERSRIQEPGWADERLESILESLLFAAGEPVSLVQLAGAIEEVPRERIRKTLNEMAAAYTRSGRGLMLEEIAGGYQLRTRNEHAAYVRRLLSAKPPRLSRPVLETLAIVAYRQPVTRPEIEQLRGVDSGGVLDTLIERSLIKVAGRKDAPGRPIVYTTTSEFLELFGLKDLHSLPDMEEFRELEGLREPSEAQLEAARSDPSQHSTQAPIAEARPDAGSGTQSLPNEVALKSPINETDQKVNEVDPSNATSTDEASSSTEAQDAQNSEDKRGEHE